MDTKNLVIICLTIIVIIGIISAVAVMFYTNQDSTQVQDSTQAQDSAQAQETVIKEDMATNHPEEFELEDLNGDGALSFDETYRHLAYTPHDPALEMFNQADSNNNSVLRGAEYDEWINLVTNSDYVMN